MPQAVAACAVKQRFRPIKNIEAMPGMPGRIEVPEHRSSTEWLKASAHIFDEIPESKGLRVFTDQGAAAHVVRPPGSQALKAREHLATVMLASSPGIRVSFDDHVVHEYDGAAGMISVTPANKERNVTWSSTCEKVIVTVPPQRFLELAAHEFGAGHTVLQPPPLGAIDLQALHLAEMLKAELARELPNKIYIESLITIFSVHIVRNYTGLDKLQSGRKSGGGLSNRSAVRVRELLESRFSRKITVAELAAVSGLSPRHFIQAFTKTFGEPPHKYVLRLRLNFAEKLLVENVLSIAEIAHLSGFSDQSHLTATMSKHRNRTPRQVRQQR
ncbi:helix-turn-helix domain-containing protein (plasmid) [Rhizobium leguminosarum]|jgi:AraC family transcriptional regulator|nr:MULTISPECIES: AraC family transcriptional regulator [Rhizobium]MCJ9691794.1 AraC family transcriptional regulator [Rhizobium sp. PRIMUS64]MDV4161930.1 AraC family transcriptional regulator [Rhizobium leguminosarum]MDV4172309.1 AraC family transcriptional regulator [Rhizobium leguminosarum]